MTANGFFIYGRSSFAYFAGKKSQIPNPKSQFPNPKSQNPNPNPIRYRLTTEIVTSAGYCLEW
jgi:hypothetical protein